MASEFQSGEFISATEITENGDYPVYGGNGLRGYANRYNHEGFYALIGRQGALCGNVNCADGKAYFTEHAVAVQANQCNDTGFLVYLLSRMNLGQYSGQSAQPGLAVSTLKEVETLLPNKHEQYRIGSLLKDLDSLITLHQRKYDKLCTVKKSMLDKMFPKPGETEPEIRFEGFTDPWEQRKLGEVAPLQRGFDLPVNQMMPGPYPVVMSNGIGGWHSKYMVKGPGVVTGRSGTIGSLHYIEQNFWPHNTSLWVTSFNGNEPRFIYWLYASIGVERFGSGSGVPTLNRNDVHDLRVGFPCDVAEQRRIGTFFSCLDGLITLHQRKCQYRGLYGYLSWEQRKFGELYRPVSEKNDMSFGRDRIISVANMYFNSVVYVTEDSYLATYNVMRLGDIAFEGNRSKRFAHGRFVENTIGDGIVSHVFKVFRPVGNNFDLSYWKHAINNEKLMKDVLTRSTKASTMMHELVSSDFLEESTLVPSLDEQRAIGVAIDSIDNLITLHQ